MLIHVCEKVTLFGFSGSKIKDWYFPKRPGGKVLPKGQWMRDKRWVVEEWKYADNTGSGGGSGVGGGGGGGSGSGFNRKLLRREGGGGETVNVTRESEEGDRVGEEETLGRGQGGDKRYNTSTTQSEDDADAPRTRRLLADAGAERHCMHSLVTAHLVTMRP